MANQIISVSGLRRQQTLITFDNGATWQKIAAPVNINGAASNCILVKTQYICVYITVIIYIYIYIYIYICDWICKNHPYWHNN